MNQALINAIVEEVVRQLQATGRVTLPDSASQPKPSAMTIEDIASEEARNTPLLDDPACAPHILNVTLSPVRSQTMLFALEGDGVYVSAGSACAAHKQKVSGVLTGMGLTTAEADCALRFSLCPSVTEADIDYTIQTVKKHYDMLKAFVRR